MSGFEPGTGRTRGFIAVSVGFWALFAALAAATAWPIYRDGHFLVLVVVSTAVAVALALLLRRRGWLTVALATVVAYLVLGVPLAVPSSLTGIAEALGGWLDLLGATVFSWKQLATITTIPVGSYQTLLVPALIVFLAGGVTAVSLAVRSQRAWGFVIPIAVAMHAFGVVYGSPDLTDSGLLQALTAQGSREAALGILTFFAALAYLLWRVRYDRSVAIRSAQSIGGIRQARAGTGTVLRRLGLGGATLLVGAVVATLAAPGLAATEPRHVLRSSIDPESNIVLTESPLTEYRRYFADDRYDADLFSVRDEGLGAARIRLAVLSHYDGQQYLAVEGGGRTGSSSAFVRVPYTLDPGHDGPEGRLDLTVAGYRGNWVPTVADLRRVDFTGSDAQDNADAFFYNQNIEAGIATEPLRDGDQFTLTATLPADEHELGPPGAVTDPVDPDLIPESLAEWVRAQDDQSLPVLIERLRARGYLSHSIFAPSGEVSWLSELGGAEFAASRAGHSVDRIQTLYSQLLDKQRQNPGATADADLVAAVGDDEQFAVAGALLAQYLGYPSRVVLGFTRDAAAQSPDDIPACTEVCKGKNLTAWIEVQGGDGEWAAFDTTPQHSNPLNPVQENQQPPKNGTDVLPDSAERQQPTANDPSGGDTSNEHNDEDALDLTWLADILKIVGIALLGVAVLIAPFATILLAKARRRAQRRSAADIEERIVGGWDEYVDTALDHGLAAPATETRTQTAARFGTPNGIALATMADRAVFGPIAPAEEDGDRFWSILESERLEFERDLGFWKRMRAALSLRSFTRYLAKRSDKTRMSLSGWTRGEGHRAPSGA